jgi:CRP-like cAMP-binding protein
MQWPLLDGLPEDDRRDLLRLARRRTFRRREVVFHEGDPGDTVHLLVRGHVAIRVTTPLGDIATLLVLQPGDFFGELALVSGGPRNSTVVALEAVETMAIRKDHFDEVRRKHPVVDRLLIEILAAEVKRLSHALGEALYLPVEKRLWRRLLDLAHIYGAPGGTVIPVTQEELANLTGTTRPTANRILASAEEAGFLRVRRGRVEVLDVTALEKLAGSW